MDDQLAPPPLPGPRRRALLLAGPLVATGGFPPGGDNEPGTAEEYLTRVEAARLYLTTTAAAATYVPQTPIKYIGTEVPGDGSDVSVSLQAFVDELSRRGGGRLILTHGQTYGISAPLRLTSNITLDLNGSTLKALSAGKQGILVTAGAEPVNGSGGDGNTVVSDILITSGTLDNQGTKANNSGLTYSMIYVERATRVRVENCRLIRVGSRQAIRFDKLTDYCSATGNCIEMPIDAPFLSISNAQGINCSSSTTSAHAGGLTDSFVFSDPTQRSGRHLIAGNLISGGTHGISLWGAHDCIVSNNILQDNSHRGIILSPVARCNTVSGNTIRDYGQSAVLIAFGSTRNTVTGNTCLTTRSIGEQDGIRCSFGATDNHIEGNIVEGALGRGIRLFTGAGRNSVIGNRVVACGIGIQAWSLDTDRGYFQPTHCPPMEGIVISANTITNCNSGIQLRQGTTTPAASTTGVAVALARATISGNVISDCNTGLSWREDSPGSMTAVNIVGNTVDGANVPMSAPRGTLPLTSLLANVGILASSTTWRPGALPAGASVSMMTKLLGTRLGDYISASSSVPLTKGLMLSASVSANDTVTVTLFNGATTPQTAPPLTVRLHAWKA